LQLKEKKEEALTGNYPREIVIDATDDSKTVDPVFRLLKKLSTRTTENNRGRSFCNKRQSIDPERRVAPNKRLFPWRAS